MDNERRLGVVACVVEQVLYVLWSLFLPVIIHSAANMVDPHDAVRPPKRIVQSESLYVNANTSYTDVLRMFTVQCGSESTTELCPSGSRTNNDARVVLGQAQTLAIESEQSNRLILAW